MSQTLLHIVGVPATVDFRSTPCKWKMKPKLNVWVNKGGEHVHPTRLFEIACGPSSGRYLDPWEVRDRFMGIGTDTECFNFLNKTGYFSLRFKDGLWGFDEMSGWQEIFRMMMQKQPMHWADWMNARQAQYRQHTAAFLYGHQAIKTSLRWKEQQNVLTFHADDTLSAIYGTIVLDKLAGSKFGFCARKDCRKPFEIQSHHNRKYCTPDCAHLEVVRRGRERKREAAKKAQS